MARTFLYTMFGPASCGLREAGGSRAACARMEVGAGRQDILGPRDAAFIAARDSFYLATVSEGGWPYVQHRGGAVGFLSTKET